MAKLSKKAKETLSVDAVRDSIMMTDHLDQFIPDNDKEPFWDGAVYIYENKDHTKENFRGRMPVQVKGTENEDFSKDGMLSTLIRQIKDKLRVCLCRNEP